MASAFPKRRSNPPVSLGPISPCSKHSMANEIAELAEMESMV